MASDSIQKKLQLILEYLDRGYHDGVDKAQRRTEALKKAIAGVTKVALASVAAIVGLTAALIKFIQKGAEVRSVTDTWEGFLKSAQMTSDTLDRVSDAVNGTVSKMDMMRASVQALATGLEPDRLIEFWEKAKQMGDVMSRDTLEVFEGLTRAYNKMEPEALETIGITIRTTQVYKEYADAIGKSVEALTLQDRKLAFSMAIEREYQKNFMAVGNVTTEVREKFQRLVARLKDMRDRFYEIVATSPRVKEFLDMLTEKLGLTNDELDKNDGQIQKVVDGLITFLDRIIRVGEGVWAARDAIVGLGVTLAAAKIGTSLSGIAIAMGGLKVSAVAVGGWVGAIVGGLYMISTNYQTVLNGILELVDVINRSIYGMAGGLVEAAQYILRAADVVTPGKFFARQADRLEEQRQFFIEQTFGTTFIDGLQAQIAQWPDFNLFELLFPSGKQELPEQGAGPKKEPGGSWNAARYMELEKGLNSELELIGDFESQKVMLYQSTAEERVGLAQWASNLEMELQEWETQKFFEAYRQRVDAYRAGYGVMSQYSRSFFDDSARRGRTLNAMMIAGFGEMVAAYIDAKTEQAKLDVMEGTYQALKFLAMGDFRGFGLMMQAVAGAAAVAGAGALAAGAIRYGSQQKAESLMSEQEAAWEAETASSDEATGQRTRATGVVNTRPISINVYSTANFNAGYMIFGDSEAAANDLYDDIIQDRVEGDIESGMIAV